MTTLRNYVVNYIRNRIIDADLEGIHNKPQLIEALCTMSLCTEEEANEFAQQYFREIISQFDVPDFGTNNIMLRDYVLRCYIKIIIYSLDLPAEFDFNEKYLKNLLDILLVGWYTC